MRCDERSAVNASEKGVFVITNLTSPELISTDLISSEPSECEANQFANQEGDLFLPHH